MYVVISPVNVLPQSWHWQSPLVLCISINPGAAPPSLPGEFSSMFRSTSPIGFIGSPALIRFSPVLSVEFFSCSAIGASFFLPSFQDTLNITPLPLIAAQGLLESLLYPVNLTLEPTGELYHVFNDHAAAGQRTDILFLKTGDLFNYGVIL
jgi:hypothetical protein